MADKLLEETSELLSTLQTVQSQLKAWSTQSTGSKKSSYQTQQSSSRPASRRDPLAEFRQTVLASKKRINDVLSQLLKKIKEAEKKTNDQLRKSPARTGEAKDADHQKAAKAIQIVAHNRSLRHLGEQRIHECELLPQASGVNVLEVPVTPHMEDTTGSRIFNGSFPQDDATSLRYHCGLDDLGPNMVSTILKARAALSEQAVDERGYLILSTPTSWDHSDLDQMLRTKTRSSDEYSKGFFVQGVSEGVQNVYRDNRAKLECVLPNFDAGEPVVTPEQEFQALFDLVGKDPRPVSYLVGPHASDTETGQKISKLLYPGPVTSRRPDLPGINSPYWYVSYERDTPSTMHIEDGFAGSANMLLAGAEKHWIVVRRSSTQRLEDHIRTEFRSQKCSQFVRHHHLMISPLWLRERNIEYDLARQRPGEIMVTLPGLTYHEIRNTGANFAVAINYEFPDAPDLPSGYNWCCRGPKRCGRNAIRLKDFQISPTLNGCDEEQNSNASAKEIINIDEDKPYELSTFLWLPEKQAVLDSDITSLIKACIDQGIEPHWFCLSDHAQVEAKLLRFKPGNQLSDDLLRQLLILIALRQGYYVLDSNNLNLDNITAGDIMAEAGSQVTGIVLPFHVNAAVQSSSEGRDHWVLAVLDIRANTFTTWGIERLFGERWAAAFDSVINDDQSLHFEHGELPFNPDFASCALCCCYALDVYLNTLSHGVTPENMRSYYLRKLLEGYRMSTVQCQLTGRVMVALPVSLADGEETDASTDGEMSDTVCGSTCSIGLHITTALADTSLVSKERKARLIQMILQCSMAEFKHLPNVSSELQVAEKQPHVPDGPGIIFALVKQIEDTSGMFLQALHSKFLLLKLHLMFEFEVTNLETQRKVARIRRRRATASGHRLGPLPTNSGKTARNAVKDQIIETIPDHDTRSRRFWRLKLTTQLEIGHKYYMLVSNLGLGLLPGLPYKEAAPCNLEDFVPNDELVSKKPIRSVEYHQMSPPEAKFFIKWFTHLNPDLRHWNRLDLKELYMGEPYWKEITDLQEKVLRTITSNLQRTYTSAVKTVVLQDGKRRKL